ncbi:DUF7322 domain-containing protein [Halorarum halobium]|uniref:DUF7322 domain-containing protein n=1 Tax=Halorarum halobium TaxID=3075121 RepID=UPI0028AAB567|nr:hypothetical protein [Halobaculum sp. XH14]
MPHDDDEEVGFGLEESGPNPAEEYVDIPEVDPPSVRTREVDPPTVRNPADDLTDPADVDADVLTAFWTAVLYANVALFGVSFGLMLIGFRAQWRWGGAAILVGLLAGVRVYQTHRAFKRRDTGGEDGDGDDEPNAGSDTDERVEAEGEDAEIDTAP